MALRAIGIEDDDTFSGRVASAITKYARDANTDKAPIANTPFTVRYTGTAWEFATLADAQAAGLDTRQTVWFIGNPGGAMPDWARTGDIWTQG